MSLAGLKRKGYNMKTYDVNVGLDVGKSFHYIYAIDKSGAVLADRQINQCEQELTNTFTALLEYGEVQVVVDQPNNIGSLLSRLCQESRM